MKIGVFSSYFWPHLGGLETYTLSLCHYLQKEGFEPVVITCNTDNRKAKEKKDFEILRLDCWHWLGGTLPIPKPNHKNRLMLNNFFASLPGTIITETRFFPLCFWATILAKRYHIRQIHIEHGSTHTVSRNPILTVLFHLYDHTFGRYVIKNARANIIISKEGTRLIKHLDGKNITYIPNSIDLKSFGKPVEFPRAKKIIFVGRLIERKGVQDLITAFLKINFKDWKLIIVGRGPYKKALKNLAQDNKKIIFTGQLEQKEIIAALRTATIFVNPSYLEGLPTSILEAMACGVPVIATNVGGTPDIIENRENGLLFRPKDIDTLAKKIKLLAKNSRLAKKLVQNTREIIPQFDWAHNIKKITMIISEGQF
jgi:glycosyltransferase involved in cell wall biosynthesis